MKYVFYEVTRNIIPFAYDAFSSSSKKLTCVSTNVLNGKPFYHTLSDLETERDMKYFMSTAAIPLASTIVEVDGHKLMDGGASDSIPLEYSIQKGNQKNVVVLTRPDGYRSKKSSAAWLSYVRYPKYKDFARTVANRADYYNDSVAMCEQQHQSGDAFVIRPSQPIIAQRMEKDPQKLEAQYLVGYEDAMAAKDALLEFVKGGANIELR